MAQIDVYQKEPNVYITEAATLPPIPSGSGSSIGAMFGVTTWGPVGQEVLVDSLSAWERIFGEYISADYPAQKQVKMFFKNGGKYLRFVRVVHFSDIDDNTTKASISALGTILGTNSAARIVINGKYDGALGNDISVEVADASNGVSGDIQITVKKDGVLAEPVYDNLSLDVSAQGYFKTIVNGMSKYVVLTDTSNVSLVSVTLSSIVTLVSGDNGLTGLVGADYEGSDEAGNGLTAFNGIDENLLIAQVDMASEAMVISITKELARWCDEDRLFNFQIASVPPSLKLANDYSSLSTYAMTTLALDSPRTAFYAPWIMDEDDGEYVSPCGAIMGVYARFANDTNKGIWWSPAGTDAKLYGIAGIAVKFGSSVAGLLNETKVNLLKTLPGIGPVIWGARTTSITKERDFKYIGARLNTSNLELLLALNTMWAVLKPNDAFLRSQIGQTATTIVNKRWRDGGLDGATPALGYRVVCDDTNNDAGTKAAGIVACQVGILNKQTAEFIWFNVAQLSSGSFSVTEGGI